MWLLYFFQVRHKDHLRWWFLRLGRSRKWKRKRCKHRGRMRTEVRSLLVPERGQVHQPGRQTTRWVSLFSCLVKYWTFPRARDSWRSCKTFPLPYFPLREEEDVISILSSSFEYTKSHSAWRSDLAVTENNKSRGSTFGPIDKFGLLLVPLWSDSTMDDWGAGLHHSCGERKGWCSRRQWGH